MVDTLPELIATLIGVATGGIGALFWDRRSNLKRKRQRAEVILRNLGQELLDTFNAMQVAKPVYDAGDGFNFYISTVAWETAVASGDLPEIIGFELADIIENQYSMLFHLRYYIEQYSALQLAPQQVPRQAALLTGYRESITKGLNAAIRFHPEVMAHIDAARSAGVKD